MKKHEKRMTENQYKTLRSLILLWFTVFVRRRYSIFLNILLAFSIVVNLLSAYVYKTGSHISIIEKPIDFEVALDMANYKSVSKSGRHNLQQRYNILYKRFLEDKSEPDVYYYIKNKKEVKDEWNTYCKSQLRKVIYIKTRMRDIGLLLEKAYPDRIEEIQKVIEQKHNEETLSDMSNYYARFLSMEEYQYITRSMD